MTILKALSIFVFLMLLVGYAYRRRRNIHVPMMLSAFAIDMGMVAYIELNRKAIKTAQSIVTSDAGPGPLMTFHIIMSIIVVLLYFWQIYTGIGKLRGKRNPSHPLTGITFLLLRFGNLVTSFMVTSAH